MLLKETALNTFKLSVSGYHDLWLFQFNTSDHKFGYMHQVLFDGSSLNLGNELFHGCTFGLQTREVKSISPKHRKKMLMQGAISKQISILLTTSNGL